jgi:hypothetical protein
MIVEMITTTVCEIVWLAGLVGWYVIRYPFERRAKKVGVKQSFFGRRESGLLALAFLGLWLIPLIYAVTGFPAALDRPLIPAVAILGIVVLCGALLLFYRSHADLGKNWSISLQIRDQRHLSIHPAPDVHLVFSSGGCAGSAAAELVCRTGRFRRRRHPLRIPRAAGRAHDDRTLRRRVPRLHDADRAPHSVDCLICIGSVSDLIRVNIFADRRFV